MSLNTTVPTNVDDTYAVPSLPVENILNKEDKANRGVANGYAPLDANAKVPSANLPVVDVSGQISTHNSATTSVHGIADTNDLATKSYVETSVSEHKEEITSVHGIVNTGELIHSTAIGPNTDKLVTFNQSGNADNKSHSDIGAWGFGVENTNGDSIHINPAEIVLNNGAKLKKGTTDGGIGGNNGIALKCSVDYELKWEAGRLYTMQQDGFTIRSVEHCMSVPTASDNITKGFVAGSRWVMEDGTIYECTNPNGSDDNENPEPAGVAHWVKYEKVSTKGGAHGETWSGEDWQNGSGGAGGSITLEGADAKVFSGEGVLQGSNAGKIDLSAKAVIVNGQNKDLHRGGRITSTGGRANTSEERSPLVDWAYAHVNIPCRGGDLTMSGSSAGKGGDINTSAGENGSGGSITTSNAGGSINTSNGGGYIDTSSKGGASGGHIDLSSSETPYQLQSGNGGSIELIGGYGEETTGGNAGSIILNGANSANGHGGSIIATGATEGGTIGRNAGSLNMSASSSGNGGSIDTSDGGGSIDTKGTGSIQLGVTGTRTTLVGSASVSDKTITLPNETGTIALTPHIAYGGIISASGVDAGSFSNGTFPMIQGSGTGGVITVLNGVISITSAGTGYVDGVATKAGGSRYNLVTQATTYPSANLPIITKVGGGITTGTFGTTANTFCQGNDTRLSTPASHTHGNITNAGAIGSTANLPLITTTSGVVTTGAFGTTANSFCQGNDSRLSNARTPTSHTHSISDVTNLQTSLDDKVFTITPIFASWAIGTSGNDSGYFGDIEATGTSSSITGRAFVIPFNAKLVGATASIYNNTASNSYALPTSSTFLIKLFSKTTDGASTGTEITNTNSWSPSSAIPYQSIGTNYRNFKSNPIQLYSSSVYAMRIDVSGLGANGTSGTTIRGKVVLYLQ